MAPDTAARCTGDDSCQVPDHWPDPASSGPHRGTATAAPKRHLWAVELHGGEALVLRCRCGVFVPSLVAAFAHEEEAHAD